MLRISRATSDARISRFPRSTPAAGQRSSLPPVAARAPEVAGRRGSGTRAPRRRCRREDRKRRNRPMSRNVYSVTEVYGPSPDSLDDAIRNAVGTAAPTPRTLAWVAVTEIRGHIVDTDVSHFHAGVTLGFSTAK